MSSSVQSPSDELRQGYYEPQWAKSLRAGRLLMAGRFTEYLELTRAERSERG